MSQRRRGELILFQVLRQSSWMAGALLFAVAPPNQLIFPARPGNVVFLHARHVKMAKGVCTICHPKLFPQDSKAPLNWKAGMHKPAEANHTSCGGCHYPGGTAFETKGNCRRCHGPEPNI